MCFAFDRFRVCPAHAALDEPGPHAAIDECGLRSLRHERTQRTRRRADHGGVTFDSLERRLETERADRGANTFERRVEPYSPAKLGGARELPPEILARRAECVFTTVGGDLLQETCHEGREAAGRDLERVLLWRGRIELRRAAGAGADPSRASLEARPKEAGADEALEPAARDAAVDAQLGRGLVRRDCTRRAAHVQERLAQAAPGNRVQRLQFRGNPRPLPPSCLE